MDITTNIAGGLFSCRAGAIIMDSGRILMVRNSGSAFYYSVGGRVKFGESARDTIVREVREETGMSLEVDRLAFIHENFFVDVGSGKQIHELCLFFLMKFDPEIHRLKAHSFREEYGEVSLHWLPLNKLNETHLYPAFFKTELMNLPLGGAKMIISHGE